MLNLGYDYATCVRNSEKVSWRLDDILPISTKLDYSRPFLPSMFSGESRIATLNDQEGLKLNQITGNAYMNLFGFVEEYILATMVDHAQAEMYGDHDAIRALLRFAEEEIKHQQLFGRFRELFGQSFDASCKVLDNAVEIAGVILSKSPIAVMLMTLHIELMTQGHYTESIRDAAGVDPLFATLLKAHWLEEAQHARIDALELDKLLDAASPETIRVGFEHYLELCEAVSGLLGVQTDFDIDSLSRATGRTFTDAEQATIRAAQHTAYRNTFLIYGMTNQQFVGIINKISADGARRTSELAASFA